MSDSRDKSPAEIQAEIEATRTAMQADVEAIGNRVSPDRLKDQAKDVVSEVKDSVVEAIQGVGGQLGNQAGSWSGRAVEVVKANPLPSALVGVGLAWLLMRSTSEEKPTPYMTADVQPLPTPSYGTAPLRTTAPLGTEYAPWDEASRNAGTGQAGGSGLSERAGELGQQVSHKADDVRESVVQGAHQAKRGFERLLDENPLVLTSVALVLGASVSLLLPGTRQEDELMGGARDQLVDKARETASAAKEVVQETADEVTQTVKDEADNQGLTPETSRDNAQSFAEKAKAVASEAVDTAKETAQQKADEKGLTRGDG
jgi:hypothetical protein